MATFKPRLNDDGMQGNSKWYSQNPFYIAGYGLPNCTCYAWGRFWEINGEPPNTLSTGNANTWFERSHGFIKGQTPQLGAIVCWDYWSNSGHYGHVAVVEKIYSDGSFLVSESGYSAGWYFKTEKSDTNGYLSWMYGYSGLKLQGFIYASNITGEGSEYHWIDVPDSAEYLSDDVINNCYCVAGNLLNYGWTLQSICGILGNAILESKCDPTRYEYGTQPPNQGYGILQWTPYDTYYNDLQNWMTREYPTWRTDIDVNGNAQCARIKWEYDNRFDSSINQWYPDPPFMGQYAPVHLTFEEYVNSTLDPQVLAEVFMYDYERPDMQNEHFYEFLARRRIYALAIYMLFTGNPPGTIITPTDKKKPKKMPVWMMIKYHTRRSL